MNILNLLALIFACVVALIMLLMPYLLIGAGIVFFVCIIAALYYTKMPTLKMCDDNEIPIKNVTFVPKSLLIKKKNNV